MAIDFDKKKHVLLLAFGGLNQEFGMPVFEFNKITSGLKNINKIYLRDQNRLWFHHGLPGVGDDIDSIATFLRQYTTHQSTHRVVAIGNSGGGYAALLFGHLLQVDEVHAFAPKTFINPIQRFLQNDLPRKGQKQILWSLLFHGHRKYFDLKKVFKTSLKNRGDFHIYYPSGNRGDNLHASRMKNLSRIHLHPYQYEKHGLIKVLKQNGELGEIIERAILSENKSCLPANPN